MPDFRTHYDNLKVSEKANTEELRVAFKNRFLKFHPDNHPGNRERTLGYLQVIKESYSILSDPAQREAHDEWIAEKRSELEKEAGSAVERGSKSEEIKTGNRLFSWKFLILGLALAIIAYFGSTSLNMDDFPVLSMLKGIDETKPDYQFNFQNQCRYPVTLAIRYWGLDEKWHKAGWWDVEPGDAVYLEDTDGNRLISNNSIWYYYAKTIRGDSIEWSGKYRFNFNGSALRMIEMEDTAGDSDWIISCDTDAQPQTNGQPHPDAPQ